MTASSSCGASGLFTVAKVALNKRKNLIFVTAQLDVFLKKTLKCAVFITIQFYIRLSQEYFHVCSRIYETL